MALAKRNRKILFRGNHPEQPARLLSSLSEFLLFYLYFCLLLVLTCAELGHPHPTQTRIQVVFLFSYFITISAICSIQITLEVRMRSRGPCPVIPAQLSSMRSRGPCPVIHAQLSAIVAFLLCAILLCVSLWEGNIPIIIILVLW
jgi:hypothetical protein